jgi:hypothetical protein
VYFVKYETRKQRAEEGDAGVEPGPGAASEEEEKKGFSLPPEPVGRRRRGRESRDRAQLPRGDAHGVDQGVVIGVRRDDGEDFEEGEAEFVLGLIKAHLS